MICKGYYRNPHQNFTYKPTENYVGIKMAKKNHMKLYQHHQSSRKTNQNHNEGLAPTRIWT